MDRSRLGSGGVRACLQAILVLVLAATAAASTASFISDCPVDFEFLNYTIITSQCKGPQYSPKLCCTAFLQFACPYSDELNDLTNDCASTMFSYINLYGKYPPGLFASECKGSKRGLECSSVPSAVNDTATSAAAVAAGIPTAGVLVMGSLLPFLLFT
ncbi:hypothetical protein Taro_012541 [Colocasia esculenta]|uniref:GPI-anchored protein LLG1-like domain-containing protein n=1 Tax=Colocasia esculenta TaxID=4460 RepID=A0A843U9F1_COLES|nr:hypothetical protein [Colocasia esculenta]